MADKAPETLQSVDKMMAIARSSTLCRGPEHPLSRNITRSSMRPSKYCQLRSMSGIAISKQPSRRENPQPFRQARFIRGAQNHGTYTQLSAPDRNDLVFLAVIANLSNSNTVGDTKAALDALYRSDAPELSG